MKKIVIYDSDHPGAFKNRCFEPSYAMEGTGHSFTIDLANEANRRGYKIMTADMFLKEKEWTGATAAYCITDMRSQNTNLLLTKGVVPFLCLSTESPLIAKDFYTNIKRRAGRFRYNLQFKGTEERLLQTGTQFSPMHYPVDSRTRLPIPSWHERNYLVLINRNKRAFYSNYSGIKNIVHSVLSQGKLLIQKTIDPWIRSREIYKDRIEAIYFFSKKTGFHLYGQGWENRIPGFSNKYHQAAKSCYKGSLSFDAKLSTMNRYKFALCFENCSFPGYVTEKIFDTFLAGCIPVYLGAPDISDFVPPDSFVDFRKFNSFITLHEYLQNITEHEAHKMLEAAANFLASDKFDKHYQPYVVNDIFNKLDSLDLELQKNHGQ